MDKNYHRYNKLFLNNQESYYLGDYSTNYKPFETPEGKLKYTSPHPDNPRDFQTKHIKYPLDDLRKHLLICELDPRNIDENGHGTNRIYTNYQKPCYTETTIGSHKVMEQTDHGIVLNPLGADGRGTWAAIDEDVYNDPQHLKNIIYLIYEHKWPIVPCYSKSGGLHLYFFFDEPFEYDEIVRVLNYYKLNLRSKAKEIFPKQPKKPGKPGNGIHLPYRSCVLEHKDGINYNFRPIKNTLVKSDLSQGTFEEFLDAAENNKISKSIFENMPVEEIKEFMDTHYPKEEDIEPTINISERIELIPTGDFKTREPSKVAAKILDKILRGKEHKDGGTFDNWIVSLVACCVLQDKRSNIEIEEYFNKVKHKSDKAKVQNYLKDKIDNCRNKYDKPDPGPQITQFYLTTVYDCEVDKYFDLNKNKHYSDKSLNQVHSKIFPGDTTPTRQFYLNDDKQIVDGLVYRPDLHKEDEPNNRIIKDGNSTYINKYVPHYLEAIEPSVADLKPFMDLMKYLFPKEKERNHVLDYLAHNVQFPGKKIRHAVLVYSKDWQVGKGSMFDLMTDILGENNCEPGSVKSILDKGVMFSEKLLVLIDECSSTGEFSEKRNLVNDLKTIISENRIQKRILYMDYGVTKQFTNFLIFTNNPDALSINANDPRYFVVDHYEKRLDQKFYDSYHKWRKDKGAAFVKFYLLHRDLKKFNPVKPPPTTEAKTRMAEHSENPLLMEMRTAYSEGSMPFPFSDSIRGTTEISEWYKKHGSMKVRKFADNPKTVKQCFEALGFLEIGQVKHKLRDEKPSLWIVRNQKDLRDRYKNTELCNEIWKPLNFFESSHEQVNQRENDNFQKISTSPENLKRHEELDGRFTGVGDDVPGGI